MPKLFVAVFATDLHVYTCASKEICVRSLDAKTIYVKTIIQIASGRIRHDYDR